MKPNSAMVAINTNTTNNNGYCWNIYRKNPNIEKNFLQRIIYAVIMIKMNERKSYSHVSMPGRRYACHHFWYIYN